MSLYRGIALQGSSAEQVGGLARRHTIIESLRDEHLNVLNLHTGNILDSANPNNELICQIALEALSGMDYDVMCLGPQDLSLPTDTLSVLYANHPDLPIICTNLSVSSPALFAPYIIHNTATQIKVAVINLISRSYQAKITAYNPSITLSKPAEALEALSKEIIGKSDMVVGVFHGEEDEARTLAEKFSWLSVLIHAKNESSEVASDIPTVVGNTTIVTNPTKGEAVGVLEIGLDPDRQVSSRQNQHLSVSERITPDADLEMLLALYDDLTEDDGFDHQESVPDDRAIYITYFHKRGCQKCARASAILKRLKTKYPRIVVELKYAKESRELLEAMGALYEVPEVKRLTTPAVFIGDEYLLDELDAKHLETVLSRNTCRQG